jgi:hypothetical protein
MPSHRKLASDLIHRRGKTAGVSQVVPLKVITYESLLATLIHP